MSSLLLERPSGHVHSVELLTDDLSNDGVETARREGVVAWDIETTGLDWRTERIATVQIQAGAATYVVQLNGTVPQRLKALIEDPALKKILHYAMFDLRFMASHWGAVPTSVRCTKIASKLARPTAEPHEHSLAPLVARYFGEALDKKLQTSDWTTAELAHDQLLYAVDDVRFLVPLHHALEQELRGRGLVSLRDQCFAHLPTRVALEVGGFPDVFAY
jgi:ribonuclease D